MLKDKRNEDNYSSKCTLSFAKQKKATQKKDKKTNKIISTAFGKGSNHDFKLFKASKTHIHTSIESKADNGYLGLQKLHCDSVMPKKKSKKNLLNKEDKRNNRIISSKSVVLKILLEH